MLGWLLLNLLGGLLLHHLRLSLLSAHILETLILLASHHLLLLHHHVRVVHLRSQAHVHHLIIDHVHLLRHLLLLHHVLLSWSHHHARLPVSWCALIHELLLLRHLYILIKCHLLRWVPSLHLHHLLLLLLVLHLHLLLVVLALVV